jgi:hypothetical protein
MGDGSIERPDGADASDASDEGVGGADAATEDGIPTDSISSGGTDADLVDGSQPMDAPEDSQDAVPAADAEDGAPLICDLSLDNGSACGGELWGSWEYRKTCIDGTVLQAANAVCPTAVAVNEQITVVGELSFASGAYQRQLEVVATVTLAVPFLCSIVAGGCGGVAQAIEAVLPGGGGTVCNNDATGGCTCDVKDEFVQHDNGGYLQVGGYVSLRPSDGGVFDYFYCVQEQTLTYKGTQGNDADNSLMHSLGRVAGP